MCSKGAGFVRPSMRRHPRLTYERGERRRSSGHCVRSGRAGIVRSAARGKRELGLLGRKGTTQMRRTQHWRHKCLGPFLLEHARCCCARTPKNVAKALTLYARAYGAAPARPATRRASPIEWPLRATVASAARPSELLGHSLGEVPIHETHDIRKKKRLLKFKQGNMLGGEGREGTEQ